MLINIIFHLYNSENVCTKEVLVQVIDSVEKALLKSDIIMREKSIQIENLKAEFDLCLEAIQDRVSELKKQLNDREKKN